MASSHGRENETPADVIIPRHPEKRNEGKDNEENRTDFACSCPGPAKKEGKIERHGLHHGRYPPQEGTAKNISHFIRSHRLPELIKGQYEKANHHAIGHDNRGMRQERPIDGEKRSPPYSSSVIAYRKQPSP